MHINHERVNKSGSERGRGRTSTHKEKVCKVCTTKPYRLRMNGMYQLKCPICDYVTEAKRTIIEMEEAWYKLQKEL